MVENVKDDDSRNKNHTYDYPPKSMRHSLRRILPFIRVQILAHLESACQTQLDDTIRSETHLKQTNRVNYNVNA